MKNKKTILSIMLTASMMATSINAAITYVDANFATNTTLADGTSMNLVIHSSITNPAELVNPQDYWTPGDQTIYAASNWGVRDRSNGNEGSVIVSGADIGNSPAAVTDAPILRTDVTGLASGTYNVYAYYRRSTWGIQSGLTEAGLAETAGVRAVSANFVSTTGMTLGTSATDELFQVSLGVATVTSGTLSVYIDDVTGNADRSWYEGVGYEVDSVPEPSSTALLGLGGLALMFRRRR